MKEQFKKILQIVLFVIALTIFLLILSARVSLFGLRSFTVVTGSMEPILHVNSVIFTFPNTYKVGDIITFKRGNITVTHRIIADLNNQFETKGDANKTADSIFVKKSDVLGKTLFSIPYLGILTAFSKTIYGFFLLIVIPISIFIAFEAKTIKEEWEKEIEKKLFKKLHEAEGHE